MPKKIIVAVHGMGEQTRCETIQQVADQMLRYLGKSGGIPLGHFHSCIVDLGDKEEPDPEVKGYYLVPEKPGAEPGEGPVQELGFGEVYWADIPRGPAADRHTLEEAKKWARSLVQRVHALDAAQRDRLKKLSDTPPAGNALDSGSQDGFVPPRDDKDYERAAAVIGEIIDAVALLERIFLVLRAFTPLHFDLRKVLVDYLGDVQIVTEFNNYRRRILAKFDAVMATIFHANAVNEEDAELYVIAHSEGSVVAFLGLLDGLARGEKACAWVKHLRGFMTIGSPLNKHLLLWPEIFERFTAPACFSQPRIQWRNYFDYGDPVGYSLDRTRAWMKATHWDRCFDFQSNPAGPDTPHDIGFTRYWLPGKAHQDYWTDNGVFDHFISTVVQPAQKEPRPAVPAPRTRPLRSLVSQAIPFLLSGVLLLLAVYLLYKGLLSVAPEYPESYGQFSRNLLAITLLLAGITISVRVPRLIPRVGWRFWKWDRASWRSLRWRLGAVGILLGSLWLFPLLLTPAALKRLAIPFLLPDQALDGAALRFSEQRLAWVPGWSDFSPLVSFFLLAIIAAVGFLHLVGWLLAPAHWGVRLLIFPGTLIVFAMAGARVLPVFQTVEHMQAQTKKEIGEMAAAWGLEEDLSEEAITQLSIDLLSSLPPQGKADPFPAPSPPSPTKTKKPPRGTDSGKRAPPPPRAGLAGRLNKHLHNAETLEKIKAAAKRFQQDLPGTPAPPQPGDGSVPPSVPSTQDPKKAVVQDKNAPAKANEAASEEKDAKEPPPPAADRPQASRQGVPIWPLLLAGVAFLYLWWLAVLLFDLAVVWRHYIRNDALADRLAAVSCYRVNRDRWDPPATAACP